MIRLSRLLQNLRKLVADSPNTRAEFWLLADRIARLGIGLLLQIVIVRHLGPAANGTLQSGLALAALFASVVELGIDSILRRELIRNSQAASQLFGTVLVLRTIAATLAMTGFSLIYINSSASSVWLQVCFSFTIALPLAQLPESWFLISGRIVTNLVAQGAAFVGVAALRLILVLSGAGVTSFAAAAGAEVIFIGVALALAFLKSSTPAGQWSWDTNTAKRLLTDSFPLLLTTLAITIYRRADVIFVSRTVSPSEAGLYAAAVRISEIGYIVPMILLNAWFPRLTELHHRRDPIYNTYLTFFFRRTIWSSVVFAGVTAVTAPIAIKALYGPAFSGAANALAIHVWTGPFIAFGIARNQWLLLENSVWTGLMFAVCGAFINVVLNLLLIPDFGIVGSASAAVIALACNMAILPAILNHTRPVWKLGWKAAFTWRKETSILNRAVPDHLLP